VKTFRVLLVLLAGLISAPALCAPAPVVKAVAFDPGLEKAAQAIDDGRFSDALSLVAKSENVGRLSQVTRARCDGRKRRGGEDHP
jgi:hypothetical protein